VNGVNRIGTVAVSGLARQVALEPASCLTEPDELGLKRIYSVRRFAKSCVHVMALIMREWNAALRAWVGRRGNTLTCCVGQRRGLVDVENLGPGLGRTYASREVDSVRGSRQINGGSSGYGPYRMWFAGKDLWQPTPAPSDAARRDVETPGYETWRTHRGRLTELHQGGGGATARQVLGVHPVLARPIHAAYIAVPFERSAVCGLELSSHLRCPLAVAGPCAQNAMALQEVVAVSAPAVRRWPLFGA
jgi:hypothetical protein